MSRALAKWVVSCVRSGHLAVEYAYSGGSRPAMIPYERTRQQTIPNSAVKIIGVGGAGANMLDRIALDGMEGAELLSCNTDVRTLTSSVAPEKIQVGRNLTKG